MNESTARAERFGVSSSTASSSSTPPPSYLWEVPSKPVSVRMNLDTVDRLEREVVESFRSLSSRGSEVGGLLLGNVINGNPARVTIEAYELVPCDYVRGPLFQLAEADTERFQRAIEQRNAAGGLRVVGFLRSHTRKGLGLDAEDLAFFTSHFREPHQIALLIRPYASKPSTAGIFIWENGVVKGEASYLEFPFRRSEMERAPQPESKIPAEKPVPAADASPTVPEPAAAKSAPRAQIVPIASRREIATPSTPERPLAKTEPAPETPTPPRFSERGPFAEPAAAKSEPASALGSKLRPPAPEPEKEREELAELVLPPLERPKRSNKLIWISAGAAAGLLLLSGALMYPGLSHKAKPAAAVPAPDAAALSLRVERSAGELLLSWNRESAAVKNAARGTLSITDGDQHENVNLDLGQLKNGNIVYTPTGSDVSFQLSVIGQNAAQTSSESVRILKTRPSPLADNTPAPPQKTPAPAPSPRNEPAPTTKAEAPVTTAPVTPAGGEPTEVADNRKPSSVRAFHAESLSQRLRPVKPTDLPEAPGLTASAPVPVAIPGLGTAPGIPAPAIPRPSAPAAAPKAGGQLQQAQLISSKPPDYPLVAKQAHVQGVVVVSAIVGVDGKVKSASAVSGPPLLQKAAVDAVRQWIYKPTTLNGAPVESETRVEVRFTGAR
jgi:protein TonB